MLKKIFSKKFLKLFLLIFIICLGFILIRVCGISNISPSKAKKFILSFGWKAPFIYIFLYSIRPLFLFPASLLSIAGGVCFGPFFGTLCDIVGGSLGAWLAFFLSRKLGMEAVQGLLGNKLKKIDVQVEEHGRRTIIYLRIIPVIPFDSISYAAGLSKMKFKDFAIGTAIGLIPGSFVYNYLGYSMGCFSYKKFIVAALFMILLFTVPFIIARLRRKKRGTKTK